MSHPFPAGENLRTPSEEGFTLISVLKALAERAWILVLVLLFCMAAAVYYINQSEVLYSTRVIVQLEQREPTAIGTSGAQDMGDLRAADLLRTVEQNLTTDDLFSRIVEVNSLEQDPGFLEHTNGIPPGRQRLIRQLASRVTVKARRGTRLIDIWVEDTDPERAQKLAKSLVEEAVRQQFELRAAGSSVANEYLQQEAERLRKNLETSEYELQKYKEDNNAVSLDEQQNITVAKLREINLNVTSAKAMRLRIEADLNQSKSFQDDPDALLRVQSISNSPEVQDAKRKITDQEALLANLRERYLPRHPKYIQAESQLAELREGVKRSALLAAERLENDWEIAKSSEAKLEESLKEQEQAALALNKLSVQFNILTRKVESDLALYKAVMQRLGETDLAKGFAQSIFRVVQWPSLPNYPSWPKKNLILLLSVFAGGVLGAGLVLLCNLLDTSIKTIDQAELATGFPVVGAIPVIDSTTTKSHSPSFVAKAFRYGMPAALKKGLSPSASLFVLDHPQSAVAESIRSLRANLMLTSTPLGTIGVSQETGQPAASCQVVLFTSALASEGKSFCAANYAVSLAQTGFKTLLLDADLRRPMVGAFFDLNNTYKGLGQLLQGEKLDSCITQTQVDCLSVVQAGKEIDNPSETFSRPQIAVVIQELRQRFDRIVIDSAPVNAVSDTLLIAHLADAACLVVLTARTPVAAVRRACRALLKSNARLTGVILNRMPASSGMNYNYYYSAESRRSAARKR